ncbi:MAG: YgjV family protein [Alphaproteobacteria bacterium]|nr:YgjV family protein [Alphaproteobacteria bacterium]
MTAETIAAALGWVGFVLAVSWPLFRSRTGMLAAQLGVCVLFTGHYALIGAMTGAWLNALSGMQAAAAVPLATRPQFRWVYLATIPVIATVMVASWQGLASAAAAVAMTIVSLGRWQIAPDRLRLFMALSVPFWFTHNALVGSLPGMVADTCTGAVLLVIILRDWRARRGVDTRR